MDEAPTPPSSSNSHAGPDILPPSLAHSEDLTWSASQNKSSFNSPYRHETFHALFTALAKALHRRQHPHAFLVGERGVGKMTLAAEFCRRVLTGEFPFLAGKRFLMIDTRFIPHDEARSRISAILAAVAHLPELVLVWDGLPSLFRSAAPGIIKAIFLGALTSCRCRVIVLCTPPEYEELAGDDREIEDFLGKVEVAEPDPATALELLNHFALGLEARYRLAIEPAAVASAVTLTSTYILNDQLPSKALRTLVQACEEVDFRRNGTVSPNDRVTEVDVVRVVSGITGIPENTLFGMADGTNYAGALSEMIFGQQDAVREVATELGLIKAGMTDPGKPASVMLFLGQTGTGKTELAKALARFYSTSKRLKTFTLGNCVEAHSVSTIIGVPPGYVGSERGGRLVTDLNADPYAVFLLDEADKAHPDVLQPFLNLFDEGWVTDQRGVKGHANKSIFILTTNVGQRMIADMAREGKTSAEISTRMKEALSQIRHSKSDRPVFTPEFLARIKRIIVFLPLGRDAMIKIANKLFGNLQKDWSDRRAKLLALPRGLSEYLGTAAHRIDEKSNGKEGGRIVRKLLAEWVEAPLQQAMANDPEGYRRHQNVIVEYDEPVPPEVDQVYAPPPVRIMFS